MNNEQLLLKALDIVTEATNKLRPFYGNVKGERKEHATDCDMVTELDRQTEQILFDELTKLDHGIGFRGEEFGQVKEGDRYWSADPIDGTDPFIRGLPFCSVQLALIEEGKPVLSIIDCIAQFQTFYALKGSGSWLGGEPIHVSERSLENGAMIFEANLRSNPEHIELRLKLRQRICLMQFCASGYELAMVASGALEAKVSVNGYGKSWDYAPGALLIQEAGGTVANIGKTSYDVQNCEVIMANPIVYKQLITDQDLPFGVS